MPFLQTHTHEQIPRSHLMPLFLTIVGVKSKRQTMKDKYKIQKKVREHNKKERRKQRLQGKSSLKKDPGVPSIHPLRKQILKEVEDAKEEEQRLKLERRKQLRAARNSLAAQKMELADLQKEAERRAQAFETAMDMQDQNPANAAKDQSRRAFFRHFAEVVEQADVILQVIDARDPLASRSDIVEALVAKSESRKRLVLVLNKIGWSCERERERKRKRKRQRETDRQTDRQRQTETDRHRDRQSQEASREEGMPRYVGTHMYTHKLTTHMS